MNFKDYLLNNYEIIKCSNGLCLIQDKPYSSYYITLQDINVYINDYYFTIPKGFKTDGASIPKYLQNIYYKPLDEAVLFAGVVHDYLCLTHMPAQKGLYDKNLYDFKNGYLYLQLFNNNGDKAHMLKLSNKDATQVYSDFVKIYAPNQYINCKLFKVNLKHKKIAAGKAFLNILTIYHWNKKRSAYMFKKIDDAILKYNNISDKVIIVNLNNSYFNNLILEQKIEKKPKNICGIQ
jgi:hypothetical protein